MRDHPSEYHIFSPPDIGKAEPDQRAEQVADEVEHSLISEIVIRGAEEAWDFCHEVDEGIRPVEFVFYIILTSEFVVTRGVIGGGAFNATLN